MEEIKALPVSDGSTALTMGTDHPGSVAALSALHLRLEAQGWWKEPEAPLPITVCWVMQGLMSMCCSF